MESNIENIVICGIGAAGANVFMNLLYAYPLVNFTVVDFDVCEMAIARPFIMSLTGMASIVIAQFMDRGEKVNMYFDKKLSIKKF